MKSKETNFWRGFTWRKFAVNSIAFFFINILLQLIWIFFDNKKISTLFSLGESIEILSSAILYGFFVALWFEPGIDDKKIRNS